MVSSMSEYFFKKQIFNSYDELNTLVMRYEKYEKQKLFNRNRIPLREDDENSEEKRNRLIYKTIRYECKFGKNYHGSEAEVRQTNYFKRNCPFFIQINKPLNAQVLRISTLNLAHNHPHVIRKKL
ncbi:hypothetical protein KQX54_014888 [Cotesia glomerata]|uniref:ZSWIM3 N-terminal domain-containing protein n=1 Tax=Cotesia glomerata TaxID=32391 RepID=A0AAV7I053_COTGL|nr:hypothetical protein KQX54_014888 [Cotesia glomerata]